MEPNLHHTRTLTRLVLLLTIVVALFPFVYLAQYNLPLSDEFIAMHYKTRLSIVDYQQLLLSSWSGRYFSNLLEIIYPVHITPWFFKMIPLLVMFLTGLLLHRIAKKIYPSAAWLLWLPLWLLFINYLPAPGDYFYYVPAIIIYTVSILLTMVYINLWLSNAGYRMKAAGSLLLHVLLLGTSELYIPFILLLSLLYLLRWSNSHQTTAIAWMNLLTVTGIITGLILLQGNQQRMSAQGNTDSLQYGLWNYSIGIYYWTRQFLPLLLLLAMYAGWLKSLPRIAAISRKITPFWLLLLCGAYGLLYAPLLIIKLNTYSRIGNIFFIFTLLIGFVSLLKIIPAFQLSTFSQRILLFLGLIICFLTGNVRKAYTDIYHGYTRQYSMELTKRYQLLSSNRQQKKVDLPAIPIRDYILKVADVNDRQENDLPSDMYQLYFQIDSIRIK